MELGLEGMKCLRVDPTSTVREALLTLKNCPSRVPDLFSTLRAATSIQVADLTVEPGMFGFRVARPQSCPVGPSSLSLASGILDPNLAASHPDLPSPASTEWVLPTYSVCRPATVDRLGFHFCPDEE